MKFSLPEFALSHFDATKHSPAITGCTPIEFEQEVNKRYGAAAAFPGYASFCTLFFFDNWTDSQVGILPITPEVEPYIRTEYEARRETELPVLMRYIPGEYVDQKAKYLCVIVYDKEQMKKEGVEIAGDYGIVNILRLMTLDEPPLPPITMMRNALGIDEGGSGVPMDREKYKASVEFWNRHVAVKPAAFKIEGIVVN